MIKNVKKCLAEATVVKPPEADDWYKAALEKAKAIAQTMKAPAEAVKLEPKVEPRSDDEGGQSEYGAGPSSSNVAGPSSSSTSKLPHFFHFSLFAQPSIDKGKLRGQNGKREICT
jgi:hypothetical protein